MKRLTILFSLFYASVLAQTADDVLRFSNQQITGTPRTLGLAGAWSTAGADIASASLNPAGLAVYRKGEIFMGASVTSLNNIANYNTFSNSDNRTSFNIPNFGIVFNRVSRYKGKDATDGIVSATFAFGLNRVNNFQQNQLITGTISNSSRTNAFALSANGNDSATFLNTNSDNYLAALAWRQFLINNNGSASNYASRFDLLNDTSYKTYQDITRKTRGRNNEYFVSGKINISNLIYLGASMVFSEIEFTSDNTYNETVIPGNTANTLKGFVVNEFYRTTGSGVGGKFGLIVRPADFIWLGVAYHTSIRHNLVDYYQNTITVNYNCKTFKEPGTPREDLYEYQLITPPRLSFGGSILLGKYAIMNADYECVDFPRGRLTSQNFSFATENSEIRTNFNNAANNYRVGTEINLANLKWRAGFAYYQTPYNTTLFRNNNAERMAITGGLGALINEDFTLDFAVVSWFGNSYYAPYNGAPTAIIKERLLNFSLGGAYRF